MNAVVIFIDTVWPFEWASRLHVLYWRAPINPQYPVETWEYRAKLPNLWRFVDKRRLIRIESQPPAMRAVDKLLQLHVLNANTKLEASNELVCDR